MKIQLVAAAALICATFAVQAQNIAVVNGKPIPKQLQDEWIAEVVENGGKDTPEARQQITDNLIANTIVTQEAEKRGLQNSPRVKLGVEYAKFRVLQMALLKDEMARHPITDAQVKARYEQEKAALGSTEYNVSHILVKDQKLAKEISEKIAKGGNFEDLAKQYSIDVGAKQSGGELGWSRPAVFVKPFGDKVASMKKGDITKEPVQTEFGWHIIRVNDVREQPLPAFDQMKDQIRAGLEQEAQQQFMKKLLDSAKVTLPKTK